MKMKSLTMPKGVAVEKETLTDRYGKFVVQPLERGFGHTLGNAMRRVLLSSIHGAAVTAVRVEGVQHEFSTLPGVLEDMSQIVLALKRLRVKLLGNIEPKIIRIKRSGAGAVTAADIADDPEFRLIARLLEQPSVQEEIAQSRQFLHDILEEGIANGELRADLDLETVPFVIGTLKFLHPYTGLLKFHGVQREQYVDCLIDVITRGMLHPEPAKNEPQARDE